MKVSVYDVCRDIYEDTIVLAIGSENGLFEFTYQQALKLAGDLIEQVLLGGKL